MAIAWIILAQFVCVQLASGDMVNVARNKAVNMSSQYNDWSPATKAVDGIKETNGVIDYNNVMHTAENQASAWWWVDLQSQVQDAIVKIYFRTDYKVRRNGVQLYTSATPFNTYPSGDLCYTVTGSSEGTDIPDVVNVTCSGTWRYLMVYTNTDNSGGDDPILDFGEVEVLGCRPGKMTLPGCTEDCQPGRYGSGCVSVCSDRGCLTSPDTCNAETGECSSGCKSDWFSAKDCSVCTMGWYGDSCDKQCYLRQCAMQQNSICDRTRVACLPGGCKPGYTGNDCATECLNFYGENCAKSCSSRQCADSSSSCDHISGACVPEECQPGYRGRDCQQVCTPTTYGRGCVLSCEDRKCFVSSSSCDHVTGQCDGGCKAGWNGSDCTKECLNFYGENCSKSCSSRQCADSSSSCDHISGACVPEECQPGYRGRDCQQVCTPTTYGRGCVLSCDDRKCFVSSSSCDHVTGQCDGGCKAGWNGSDCTKECPAGTYGPNCSKLCSGRNCKTESENCSRVTGVCPGGCKPGWKEEDCSIDCPDGTFGLTCVSCNTRHCQVETDCSGDGTCSGECQDGWTLDNCTQACPSGTYGPRCSFTCGNCSVGDICNHETGHCPGNCIAGWEGSQCQQRTTSPTANIMPAVVGAIAGVLIVVIIIIIVFILYRRRHNPSSKKTKQTSSSDSPSPESLNGGNMYVNVAYVENEAAKEKKEKPPLLKKPKSANKPNKASPELLNPEQEEEIVEEDKPSSQKGEYYNLGEDVIREVPVAKLADTIQKIKHRKGGFEAEYDRLPIGFTALYDDSQKPENAGKNKFRGYYPYDHNRVRLSLIPNIPGSDYINASLMHSYDQKKTYIAAQAPNKKTVGDFWRMIWEHRCNRVIMLTGLVEAAKVKCYKYWPDSDAFETDQHKVEVEVTDIRANYTIRHLKITSKDGECRSIVQYHFTSWPDHGVPDTLALVHFIWMIRRTDTQTDGPLLVHCSAGIGRTGTYIAVDSLLDQARAEGMVNVHGYVSVMRGQRKNMIQTKEQYECVFHCLVDMTTFGNTSMDVGTFAASYSSRGMDSMVDRKTIRGLTQMAITEERCDQPDRHKMWVDGNQDYTVRVGPTLRNVRGYMQTNAPPSGQEKLLWKLVEQNDVHNVVAISPLQVTLLGEKGTTMTYGDVTLKTMDVTSLTSDLTMATLQLHVTDGGTFQNVKLFKFSGSPTMDSMSSHLLDQADLQHLSLELSRVVLIHSESDRKFAILFCIMGNILSGMMEDRRVDVIGHVRTFLKCCPDVTFTEQDVEKLHVFAQKCVQMTETSNTYANL